MTSILNVIFLILIIWSISVAIVVYFTLSIYKFWRPHSANAKTTLWTMLLVCGWLAPISPLLLPSWFSPFSFDEESSLFNLVALFSTYISKNGKIVFLVIWIGGVIYHGVRLILSRRYINRLLAAAEKVENPEVHACVDRIRRMMFLESQIEVLEAEDDGSPFVARFQKPILFLPKFIVHDSSPRELEAVIAHELAHHYRYDLHIHHAMYGLKAILWFIPPIHAMYKELLKVQDTASDEYAASLLGSNREYAEVLVQIVSRILKRRRSMTNTVFYQRENDILFRLENMIRLSLAKVSRISLVYRFSITLYSLFMLLLIGFLVKAFAPNYAQSLLGKRAEYDLMLSSERIPENAVPGMGFHQSVRLAATTAKTECLGIADVNADGYPDWVIGVEAGKANRIFFNKNGKASSRSIELDNRRYKAGNVAFADVDQDGDTDIAFCSPYQANVIHLNDGKGNFSPSVRFGPLNNMTETIQLGDLNQDGWVDVVTANRFGVISLYMNNGQSRFTALPVIPIADTTRTPSFLLMDVDQDADLDIVTLTQVEENPIRVYLNDSQGQFAGIPYIPKLSLSQHSNHWIFISSAVGSASRMLLFTFSRDTARVYEGSPMDSLVEKSQFQHSGQPIVCDVGDVDEDGDLDLLVGNLQFQPQFYLNEGGYHFSAPYPLGESNKKATFLRFSDLDHDGDSDILSLNTDGTLEGYRNQLPLRIRSATPAIIASITSPSAPIAVPFTHRIKIPNSTVVDLYGTQTGKRNGSLRLEKDYTLVFDPKSPMLPGEPYILSLRGIQTVNRESLQRPYVMTGYACAAKAPMRFDAKQKDLNTADMPFSYLKLGDVDGDHDLDLIVGDRSIPTTIFQNQGHGEFVESTHIGLPQDNVESIAVVDMDSDGDLDLLLGYGNNVHPRIFFNNVPGNFSQTQTINEIIGINSLVVPGDVNGDGRLDLVFVHNQNPAGDHRVVLIREDGEMEGSCRFGDTIGLLRDLQLCDFDRDGDLDILTAAYGGNNFFFANDGKGHFNAGSKYLATATGVSLRCADFDADGDFDVMYRREMSDGTSDLLLVLNDGKGKVEKEISLTAQEKTSDLQIGDLDGDGRMDAVISGKDNFPTLTIFHNLGNNQFARMEAVKSPSNQPAALALGDLDGDGDLDILRLEKGGRMRLFYNEGTADQFARNVVSP